MPVSYSTAVAGVTPCHNVVPVHGWSSWSCLQGTRFLGRSWLLLPNVPAGPSTNGRRPSSRSAPLVEVKRTRRRAPPGSVLCLETQAQGKGGVPKAGMSPPPASSIHLSRVKTREGHVHPRQRGNLHPEGPPTAEPSGSEPRPAASAGLEDGAEARVGNADSELERGTSAPTGRRAAG